VCVCGGARGRRRYLGLCDESVSVARKVLRAACRLLIHIRRGWFESVAGDTGRWREMEGWKRERLDKNAQKKFAFCRRTPDV